MINTCMVRIVSQSVVQVSIDIDDANASAFSQRPYKTASCTRETQLLTMTCLGPYQALPI